MNAPAKPGVQCFRCKGLIEQGEPYYDIGLVHTMTDEGFVTRKGYQHVDGRCSE